MKTYNSEADYEGNGMELHNIEYDNPALTIIFIVVGWNGEHFSFLNNLSNRMDFRWERWRKFKPHLQPYTCHAFLTKSYSTNSPSRNGMTAVEHLAEFGGIKEARVFNALYLQHYQRWMEVADADYATQETLKWKENLESFSVERGAFADCLAELAGEQFRDEELEEMLQFALRCAEMPDLNFEEYIDTGFVSEMMSQFQDLEDE